MKRLSDLRSPSNGEKAVSQLEAATPSNIALGIERIGFAGLRFSLLSVVVVAVLAVAAVFGVLRIKVDNSLNQLFRSETPQFKQYEEVTKRFPSSEYDVLVVVQGKALLSRNAIDHLRDLVTDLQLVDGARGIISLFSARQPSQDGGLPGPLFPDELPTGSRIRQAYRENQVERNHSRQTSLRRRHRSR